MEHFDDHDGNRTLPHMNARFPSGTTLEKEHTSTKDLKLKQITNLKLGQDKSKRTK